MFFGNPNFQCSSKTHFLSHTFEDPSCRICSYGPHGPFWFSVKFHLDMENPYQKICFGKSNLLRLSWKWINSLEVYFEKLPYVRKHPQGLLFLINRHFWNFGTCPFWRNCTFAHIWSLRKLSGAFLRQSVSPRPWDSLGSNKSMPLSAKMQKFL